MQEQTKKALFEDSASAFKLDTLLVALTLHKPIQNRGFKICETQDGLKENHSAGNLTIPDLQKR